MEKYIIKHIMPGGMGCCGSIPKGKDPIQENAVVFNYGDTNSPKQSFYVQPYARPPQYRFWVQKSCAKLFVSITEILK